MLNDLSNIIRPKPNDKFPELSEHTNPADATQAHYSKELEYERDGKWPMHVSEAIDDFCDRKHFLLCNQENKPRVRRTTLADRVVWAIGRATEQVVKEAVIAEQGKNNCYGVWKCMCENLVTFGFGKDPFNTKCSTCKTSVLSKYFEATLQLEDLIRGNPDLLVRFAPTGKLTVVECKSMTGELFKDLKAPKIDHIMQAFFYLKLMETLQDRFKGVDIDTDRFFVHYVNKNYQFKGTYQDSVQKCYEVKVSEMHKDVVAIFDDTIKRLRIMKNSINPPARTKCDSPSCKEAKKCPVLMECFSSE